MIHQSVSDNADERLLLTWLEDRDVPCPRCQYNLRNLSTAVCPECEEPLMLSVANRPHNIIWLLLALMPCFFSGIAACFLAIPIVMTTIEYLQNANQQALVPWPILVTEIFGILSGTFGIVLIIKREWFLSCNRKQQQTAVIIIWCIHLCALFLLVGFALRFI